MRVCVAQKLPSAIERYGKETKRVIGVLDAHLKRKREPYLVGDRLTYVDLAWLPWHNFLYALMPEEEGLGWDWEAECPAVAAWYARLMGREAVKAVYAREDFQRR